MSLCEQTVAIYLCSLIFMMTNKHIYPLAAMDTFWYLCCKSLAQSWTNKLDAGMVLWFQMHQGAQRSLIKHVPRGKRNFAQVQRTRAVTIWSASNFSASCSTLRPPPSRPAAASALSALCCNYVLTFIARTCIGRKSRPFCPNGHGLLKSNRLFGWLIISVPR